MAADELHLHPEIRRRLEWIRQASRARGLAFTLTSGYRSSASQGKLYDAWIKRGRTGLPAAPPGTSTHNYGCGLDLVMNRGRLEDLVPLAAHAGLIWAGVRDLVHFDPFGFDQWRAILKGAGLIA